MKSIANLLTFIDNNWTYILIIIGALISIYKKVNDYIKLSKKKKVDIAIKIASQIILEKLANAEQDWAIYQKSGTIKRSKVINDIYEKYPILKEYADQDYIIEQIDAIIDQGLKDIKKVITQINENPVQTVVSTNKKD